MQFLEYKENKQRGTADFPIEYYYVDCHHPQYAMPYHWHLEYEILRIVQGRFTLFLEDREFCLSEGDMVFIDGGILHAGIPVDCIYECVVFDLNALLRHNRACQPYVQRLSGHDIFLKNFFPADHSPLHRCVWNLFDSIKSGGDGSVLITLGCLYQIFGLIFKNGYYRTQQDQEPKVHKKILQIKQVFELIENSYAGTLTLEQLSKAAGMSPKYFCRFFQEITHSTPIDYLNYYRIERACYLLMTTDQPITEIALSCGFNDLSYFIKTFKRYKGITPKKYR